MVNDDRIKILPHVKDLGEFYRSIDVLVLPSRENDPFGLVAAEAMSIGVPVIVTDQCGIAGYLRDGLDAVIVKANDEEALRAGIIKMLDADLRAKIAEHGKQTAQEKFSVERMIEAYEKVILQT
jgi:glycosyltransferase involved in cell wall biosynthesis